MVKYNCELCNFLTNQKNDYNRHLTTKKHKKKEETKGLLEEKKLKNPHKTSQNLTNLSFLPHKTSQNLTNFPICQYCQKSFKRKDNLKRHLEKYCKEKLKIDKDEFLMTQLYEQKKMFEENQKEKEKLYAYIDKLIEKTGDTNINIENQTNNQIILNNFGNEDISHISDKFMQKLLSIPYVGVQKLIEKVHFNQKKPENKNIALTNKKEKMIKIFKNNKWKYKSKNEIMDEIINTNYTRMDDFYSERGKDKLNINHNNKYLEFQGKFENQDNNLHDKIHQECEMILLSDNL
jgi:hypothetical protein